MSTRPSFLFRKSSSIDCVVRALPGVSAGIEVQNIIELPEILDLTFNGGSFLAATRQSDTAPARELGLDANSTIADGFLRLAGLPIYPLDRLSHYEYMLWRQARQIMFMLESLRRRKRVSRRAAFPFSIREI